MKENDFRIEPFMLQHFCIKDKNPIEIIQQKYNISNLSSAKTVNEIDMDFIFSENDESKNFILLTDLNNWSYLIWKYWDFEFNIDFAKELSEGLKSIVNYYFVDSYIATVRWIFAENGKITRAYFESHEEKLFDIGINEIENNLKATTEGNFVESIFWELYEKTCNTLEYVNKQKRKEFTIYTGTIV